MHDLGWDPTGQLVTDYKRFEVDAANAPREFIPHEVTILGKEEDEKWAAQWLQLLWDAIALRVTALIALHEEVEVQATVHGIVADFVGAKGSFVGLSTLAEYKVIVAEFPRLDFTGGGKANISGFCRTNPEVTYDNFVGDFGERFVEGDSREGRKVVDLLMGTAKLLRRSFEIRW